MAAPRRGDSAKALITQTLLDSFGSNAFVYDKKIYINANDGNETVQIAVALTMPKTPVENATTTTFEAAPTPTQLSPEDRRKVDSLMQRLGIE